MVSSSTPACGALIELLDGWLLYLARIEQPDSAGTE
jgi:hypothetical protein